MNKPTMDRNYAWQISNQAGTNWSYPNADGSNCYLLLDEEIERAANLGKKSVSLLVKKYNYASVHSNYVYKGFTVSMPQAIVECDAGLINTPSDPNLVINTPIGEVVVTISWN